MLRAIIFDLDGLIADTEPLHMRAFNLVLQSAQVPYQFTNGDYGEMCVGIPVHENALDLRARFGLTQPAEEIVAAQRALYALLLSDARNLKPMRGLFELLDTIERRGLVKAVASGSQQDEVGKILRGLKIEKRFAAVASGTNRRNKPHPDIYLDALAMLHVAPEHALALEDSHTGIRAAQAAGLRTIAVPSEFTRHQDLSLANVIVESLSDVIPYLN